MLACRVEQLVLLRAKNSLIIVCVSHWHGHGHQSLCRGSHAILRTRSTQGFKTRIKAWINDGPTHITLSQLFSQRLPTSRVGLGSQDFDLLWVILSIFYGAVHTSHKDEKASSMSPRSEWPPLPFFTISSSGLCDITPHHGQL